MNDATLAQGTKVLNLILQKKTPVKELQFLLSSGFLADMLDTPTEIFESLKDDSMRIARARLQLALGIAPQIEFVNRYHLRLDDYEKTGGKSISQLLDEKAVRYDAPTKRSHYPWGFVIEGIHISPHQQIFF